MRLLLFLLLCSYTLNAQTPSAQKITVFLDCSNGGNCFPAYVRQEIPVVDFVRDRLDADVHIVITTQYNSSGSANYIMNFIGRKNYIKYQDTLVYVVAPQSTEDETRNLLVSNLKAGLIPYLAKNAQLSSLAISFKHETKLDSTNTEKDPWNYWVFQLGANGYMSGSQNYFEGSAYVNVSADKETEKTKTNIYLSNSEEIQKYRQDGITYKYKFLSHNAGIQHYHKLTQHWAFGAGSDWTNSLFSNYKLQMNANANAEYSIFPYKDFNTKRWVVNYNIGPLYNNYYDTTIYLKTSEFLFQHSISSIFSYIQPWGATHVGIFWNNFLNDFRKNNLSLNGALQFRIVKGLNVAIWGNYSFVRDQINIRKGDIDLSQLLVRNTELLSNYDFNLGVGIKYRFGSKFNNAVNPAFRGLNYSINL